jgi:hypothetical protein
MGISKNWLQREILLTRRDNCLSILLLELAELGTIDETCNDITHVKWLPYISTYDSVELMGRVKRRFRGSIRL